MQKREKAEKRQNCRVACRGIDPSIKPIDFDVDFEGLAMAWKEARDLSERRG